MDLSVRIIDDAEHDAWDAFVYSTPNGSIFSTAEYLRILCAHTGDSFRIAAIQHDKSFLAGVAIYEHRRRWGPVMGPRLLLPYTGLVYPEGVAASPSQNESKELKLQAALAEFLEKQGFARLMVKCRSAISDIRVFMERGWQAVPTYTYVVDFKDIERQWTQVDKNLKRLIRRCATDEFEVSDDDDFDSFYRLHRTVHEQKGAPLYLPQEGFKQYFIALKREGRARLLQARTKEGQAVASQLVLTGAHTLSHTVAAGSDPEFTRTGVNAFLRWKSFERLAELGYEQNDLTDASLNSVSRFKSQLGGDLKMSFALQLGPTLRFRLGSKVESAARAVKGLLNRG